ncbi:MAG TPA: hypothetical protein PLL88_06640 [Anaerolineaceae bacterium]|nr:hypothetical protein [Anaerolineaceae bacterium]
MGKKYTKNTWTDEELVDDPLYNILQSDDTPINEEVKIELSTEVIAAGSPVNASRMNNIENGIDALDDALDLENAPEKEEPIAGDLLLLADSEDDYAHKSVDVSALGGGNAPETTAENDFQVGNGLGAWVKKTLAEVLTILGKAAANGLASLDASSKVIQDPANATSTPTASKIPIADAGGKLDGWVKRIVEWRVIGKDAALTTGDGKDYFIVPADLDGYKLVDFDVAVDTVSSSGAPTVQLHNATDNQDVLSTPATIDASEYTSYTAATPPVIDTDHDDVATGDRLRCDVDAAGTDTKGLTLIMVFQEN